MLTLLILKSQYTCTAAVELWKSMAAFLGGPNFLSLFISYSLITPHLHQLIQENHGLIIYYYIVIGLLDIIL